MISQLYTCLCTTACISVSNYTIIPDTTNWSSYSIIFWWRNYTCDILFVSTEGSKKDHNENGRDTFCETCLWQGKEKGNSSFGRFWSTSTSVPRYCTSRLPELLEKIWGKQLCVSLIFDEHYRHWDDNSAASATKPVLPNVSLCLHSKKVWKCLMKIFTKLNRTQENKDSQLDGIVWDVTESLLPNLLLLHTESLTHRLTVWCWVFGSQGSLRLLQLNGELSMNHLQLNGMSSTIRP